MQNATLPGNSLINTLFNDSISINAVETVKQILKLFNSIFFPCIRDDPFTNISLDPNYSTVTMIDIVGAPCSGKTTFLKYIELHPDLPKEVVLCKEEFPPNLIKNLITNYSNYFKYRTHPDDCLDKVGKLSHFIQVQIMIYYFLRDFSAIYRLGKPGVSRGRLVLLCERTVFSTEIFIYQQHRFGMLNSELTNDLLEAVGLLKQEMLYHMFPGGVDLRQLPLELSKSKRFKYHIMEFKTHDISTLIERMKERGDNPLIPKEYLEGLLDLQSKFVNGFSTIDFKYGQPIYTDGDKEYILKKDLLPAILVQANQVFSNMCGISLNPQ